MDRRQFLGRTMAGIAGAGMIGQIGCRNRQTAQVLRPGEADMVGSHSAGASVYGPLVEEAVGKLLGRQSRAIQPVGMSAAGGYPLRICFVGVENKSIEELGDFKEQIYQNIDTQIVRSDVFQPISRRYVEAGLRQSRLRPDELFIPQNMRTFVAIMEQQGQPFEYLLYATLTSGTTHSNKDYQRDYLLTLEMINVQTGDYDKESAKLSKGYNRSPMAKMRGLNPFR